MQQNFKKELLLRGNGRPHYYMAIVTLNLLLSHWKIKSSELCLMKPYLQTRRRDVIALEQALTTCSIDVWKTGRAGHTAAFQLALENERDSVQFLLEHGANIHIIAQGAAQGGHRAYAESLREIGANTDIAYGAARAGHREYAEFLRANND